MELKKLTQHTDEEFRDDSIRCCREAIASGDGWDARFWADHVFSFARLLYRDWMWFRGAQVVMGDTFAVLLNPHG